MALLSTSQKNYLDGISPFAIEMAGLKVGTRLANINDDGSLGAKLGLYPKGSAAASASGSLMGIGTTAAPALTTTANEYFIEVRAKSTATSGTGRLCYFRYDTGGAGAEGEGLRVINNISAAASNARGGNFSVQTTAATGYVTGEAIGLQGQLSVGAGAIGGGTMSAMQSQLYLSAATSAVGSGNVAVHSFNVSGDNTLSAGFINLFRVDTLAGQVGNLAAKLMVSSAQVTTASTGGLQVRVNGTQYWIPLHAIA